MILNEHQLNISQQRLKELRQAFLKLGKKYPKPEDFEFYLAILSAQLSKACEPPLLSLF